MESSMRSVGIAVCGLVTSVVIAFVTAYLSQMWGTDIFTLSVWVVFPAGAIGVGVAAASGYYFASLWLHQRPTKLLLLQMVVIAGLTQLLIYYLGYRMFDLGNGRYASDVVPFGQYLDLVLTKEHLQFGRTLTDVGEAGQYGYWLAAIQFIGFLLGGFILWAALRSRPFCGACRTYLRKIAGRVKRFTDSERASQYYDHVFTQPIGSAEFAAFIQSPAKVDKARKGTVEVKTVLFGCPSCADQVIKEELHVFNGREWKEVPNLRRLVAVPSGHDLRAAFQAK